MEPALSEKLSEGDDMKWRCSMLVAAFLLQIGYVPCAARETLPVAPGSQVLIIAPSISAHRLLGTIVTVDADTLTLRIKNQVAPLAVPVAAVEKLYVSSGRKRHLLKGAAIGGFSGVGLGAIVGLARYSDDPPNSFNFNLSKEQKVFALSIALGGVGLIVGTMIGGLAGDAIGDEIWQPVLLNRIRVGITPQPQGGFALSTSFSF